MKLQIMRLYVYVVLLQQMTRMAALISFFIKLISKIIGLKVTNIVTFPIVVAIVKL